jgi:exopolyphosphatase/guanosine-5'-triphosphate,3'-diphosphate pyrophosphatase
MEREAPLGRLAQSAAMRVATVDIGTNTVLLLVADRLPDGKLVAVTERATITRLGEGVDRSRRLLPAAIARTRECLAEYGQLVASLGVARTAVVGTSAMRDAAGGEQLLADVRAWFGVEACVVSGENEARLTCRGALSGLDPGKDDPLAVFDIGGGSTEIVLADKSASGAKIYYAASFDVGSVRLTERHVRTDPPSAAERAELAESARDAFNSVPKLRSGQCAIGIAGTMTTLAAVSLGLIAYDGARVHGYVMTRAQVREVVDALAALPLAARRAVAGMEPKRADVIVAGGYVALALLEHWEVAAVTISDRGVRWGLASELADATS